MTPFGTTIICLAIWIGTIISISIGYAAGKGWIRIETIK